MRVAHILRKYNPAQWGGTETVVLQLTTGLQKHAVASSIFAPALDALHANDPLAAAGNTIHRYKAFVPVTGINDGQRAQLISVGGNIMSFDLIWRIFREPADIIHSHALNRIGGIGLTAARARKLPFVVTIHGGVLDLPQATKDELAKPLKGGFEWGKVFGPALRSRKVLAEADAILTCNPKEAALLQEKYPDRRIVTHPHGVQMSRYAEDHREAARRAFPALDVPYLLVVGRVDPVKNQGWVLEQFPQVLKHHPNLLLVFAGPCTDEAYGKQLKKDCRRLAIEDRVLFTGGLPPGDPRLIGLLQGAAAVVVPSHSETFGIVILEAWAAQRPVLSTRNSGALSLIEENKNGHLFDLNNAAEFHNALDRVLFDLAHARNIACAGWERAKAFDVIALAGRIKGLYSELIAAKKK